MRLPKVLLAASAALALLAGQAFAAPALVNNNQGTAGPGSTSVTVTLPFVSAGNVLLVGVGYCGTGCTSNSANPTITGADTAGNTFTSVGGANSTNIFGVKAFRAPVTANLASTDTITITFGAAVDYPIVDVAQFSGLDATATMDGSVVTGASDALVVPTTVQGDVLYTMIETYGPTSPGPNQTALSNNSNNGGSDTYEISGAAGNYTVSYSAGVGGIITPAEMIAFAIKPAVVLATPTSAACVPSSPSLPDTSLSGATVCALTVTMSNGSTYTGSNTISPSSLVSVPGTGNGNVTLARNLAGTDDGVQNLMFNGTQNGTNVALTIPLNITPPAGAGTPEALGWKGVNPGGNGSPDAGTVIFTAPRAMTVSQITGRITVPATSPALLDVYKAANGAVCGTGTKLHTGDFNAAGAANATQSLLLSTVAGALNLAQGDSVCVVTSGAGWQAAPSTADGTITVTAN